MTSRFFTKARRMLGIALALTTCAPAVAQDECTTATPLVLGDVLPFDTSAMTSSLPDWTTSCSGSVSSLRPDQWFEFIAPTTGKFLASTCGGGPSKTLEVFRGTCGALEVIDCDGNRCRHDDSFSRGGKIYFQADAGEEIRLRVGNWLGGPGGVSGSIQVTVAPTASNDDCGSPAPIAAGDAVNIDLFEATAGGDPVPCGAAYSSDLWFEFIPTVTATYEASTCGWAGSTLSTTSIAHYSGTCGALVLGGCSTANCNSGRDSVHFFQGVAGQRYLLRVMGHYYLTYGTFTLNRVGGAPGDECSTALTQAIGQFQSFNLNGTAVSLPPWSCEPLIQADTWRRFVAPTSANYFAYAYAQIPTAQRLAVEVFLGDCTTAALAGCTSGSGSADIPIVTFWADAGEEVRLRVGSNQGAGTTGSVRVVLGPPNDRCSEATVVPLEASVSFQSGEASRSPYGWACGTGNDPDIWFQFQAAVDGPLRVEVCEPFDSIDRVEIYDGDCSNLQRVACDFGAGNCQARAPIFQATAGTTYFVRVNDANYNASGEIRVTAMIPPSNDTCGSAIVLLEGGTETFDLAFATSSQINFGFGGCVGNFSTADLFYTFTPTASAPYAIRACADVWGTALEVLRGTCASAQHRACGGAYCGSSPGQPGATTEVELVGGQAYLIRVSAAFGTAPVGSLTVTRGTPPPNDECSAAPLIGPGTTVYDLAFATESHEPLGFCEGTQSNPFANDIWFRYAPLSGGFTRLKLCDAPSGTALALYEGASCSSLQRLDCSLRAGTGECGEGPGRRAGLFATLVPGQVYWLRIASLTGTDGFSGTLTIDELSAGNLGSPYCVAVPNSTGSIGDIESYGSAVAADNDLILAATSIPTQALGYFITSRTQGFSPLAGGSMGNLCVAGNVGRFNFYDYLIHQTFSGDSIFHVPLGAIPQLPGYSAALPGETWNFQFWHRDAAGGSATSNFTRGHSVLLQ